MSSYVDGEMGTITHNIIRAFSICQIITDDNHCNVSLTMHTCTQLIGLLFGQDM